jgi:hypothetical protein
VASGNSVHAVLWRERHADADVLGNADLALYPAKAGGRNTFCFFNVDIEKATLARHRLERELPVALPRQGHPTRTFTLPVDFDARATQGRKMPPLETAPADGHCMLAFAGEAASTITAL